jgi:hypothetical protein
VADVEMGGVRDTLESPLPSGTTVAKEAAPAEATAASTSDTPAAEMKEAAGPVDAAKNVFTGDSQTAHAMDTTAAEPESSVPPTERTSAPLETPTEVPPVETDTAVSAPDTEASTTPENAARKWAGLSCLSSGSPVTDSALKLAAVSIPEDMDFTEANPSKADVDTHFTTETAPAVASEATTQPKAGIETNNDMAFSEITETIETIKPNADAAETMASAPEEEGVLPSTLDPVVTGAEGEAIVAATHTPQPDTADGKTVEAEIIDAATSAEEALALASLNAAESSLPEALPPGTKEATADSGTFINEANHVTAEDSVNDHAVAASPALPTGEVGARSANTEPTAEPDSDVAATMVALAESTSSNP